MIVYGVGDGFQDAWGRECTADGTLLNPELPPPINDAALEALAVESDQENAEDAAEEAQRVAQAAASKAAPNDAASAAKKTAAAKRKRK